MAYSEYSICTWFYLNKIYDYSTLYLIVMTENEGDISSAYNKKAPALWIMGTNMFGQVVTNDGTTDRSHTVYIENLLIEKWYHACVVVD